MNADVTKACTCVEHSCAICAFITQQQAQPPADKVWLVFHFDHHDGAETLLGAFLDQEDVNAMVWWFGAAEVYVQELSANTPTKTCLDCQMAWQSYYNHPKQLSPCVGCPSRRSCSEQHSALMHWPRISRSHKQHSALR